MKFTPKTWPDFEAGVEREWVIANGLGGFASGTIIGVNSRLYHGLLISAQNPPVNRMLTLSKVDEEIEVSGEIYQLGTNQWEDGSLDPRGNRYQQSFVIDPFPTFVYRVVGVIVIKRVFMVHGQNTTVVRYTVHAPGRQIRVTLRPLANCRDHHGVSRGATWSPGQELRGPAVVDLIFPRSSPATQPESETSPLSAAFAGTPGPAPETSLSGPRLSLSLHPGTYHTGGQWVRGMKYSYEEKHRLEPHLDDHYAPGVFTAVIDGHGEITLVASTEANPPHPADGRDLERWQRSRLGRLEGRAGYHDPTARILVRAADSFIVQRASTASLSVIAGYHWFTDWGRDTMIALPGLTLATHRYEDARDILGTFARYVQDGLAPNCFPDEGVEPMYNTVDASLWFFWAAHRYLAVTGDEEFVHRTLYPVLKTIVEHYRTGTRFNIGMDQDGLIQAGSRGLQLTWMDAKVGDWVVTPREGKPVEINALWHNALRVMSGLARRFWDEDPYRELAEKVARNFRRSFWNGSKSCLFDVIGRQRRDDSIRPNQIIALSLPYPLLSPDQEKGVLNRVQENLLTPYGLRSLSPDHPDYHGRYRGDRVARDGAYHQGTVWGWLIGPFCDAYRRVHGDSPATRDAIRALLRPLLDHLVADAGVGSISEIFEGDPPHRPVGCIAQAWSVAEVLRVWAENEGFLPIPGPLEGPEPWLRRRRRFSIS